MSWENLHTINDFDGDPTAISIAAYGGKFYILYSDPQAWSPVNEGRFKVKTVDQVGVDSLINNIENYNSEHDEFTKLKSSGSGTFIFSSDKSDQYFIFDGFGNTDALYNVDLNTYSSSDNTRYSSVHFNYPYDITVLDVNYDLQYSGMFDNDDYSLYQFSIKTSESNIYNNIYSASFNDEYSFSGVDVTDAHFFYIDRPYVIIVGKDDYRDYNYSPKIWYRDDDQNYQDHDITIGRNIDSVVINGEAYIASVEDNRITVRKFTPFNNWSIVGQERFSENNVERLRIKKDKEDGVWLVYNVSSQIYIRKFYNGSWNLVSNITNSSRYGDLDFDDDNIPHVVYRTSDSGTPIQISRLNVAQEDLDSIEIITEPGENLTNVISNLIFPLDGNFGSNITWDASGHPAVDDNGNVTRGMTSQTGQITAAASKGPYTETKSWDVTVYLSDAGAVAATYDWLEIQLNSNPNLGNVTTNLGFPTSGLERTTISWDASGHQFVSNTGAVSRNHENNTGTVVATISKGTESATKEFTITVLLHPDALAVYNDKNWLQIDPSPNISVLALEQDFNLQTSGPSGSNITWQSSNPARVSSTGQVDQIGTNVNLTLTATITSGSYSQNKTFSVIVSYSQDYIDIENDFSWLGPGSGINLGLNSTLNGLEYNISFSNTGINGSSINWDTSDHSALTPTGEITPGIDNKDVTITATLTRGSETRTKSFQAIVYRITYKVIEGRFIKDTGERGEGIEEALDDYWINVDIVDKSEVTAGELKQIISNHGGDPSLVGETDNFIDEFQVNQAIASTAGYGYWATDIPGGTGELGDVVIDGVEYLDTNVIHNFYNLTLNNGAKILANGTGNRLVILVRDTLTMAADSSIEFNGENGVNGANGDDGDAGAAGSKGGDGGDGGNGSTGETGYSSDNGGNRGDYGAGGGSGTTAGTRGGYGGEGGSAEDFGQAESGDPGESRTNSGVAGSDGGDGSDGSNGTSGSIGENNFDSNTYRYDSLINLSIVAAVNGSNGTAGSKGDNGTGGNGGSGGGGGASKSNWCGVFGGGTRDASGGGGGGGGGGGQGGKGGEGGFPGSGGISGKSGGVIYIEAKNFEMNSSARIKSNGGSAGLGGSGGDGGDGGSGGGGGKGGDGGSGGTEGCTTADDGSPGVAGGKGGDGGKGGTGGRGGDGANGNGGLVIIKSQNYLNGSPSYYENRIQVNKGSASGLGGYNGIKIVR